MPKNNELDIFAVTDIGRAREENQDDIYEGTIGNKTTVLIVADGMGGHAGGSLASREAVLSVVRSLQHMREDTRQAEALEQALKLANLRILEIARDIPQYRSMGTTLTAAAISGGKLCVAHVGDSRAYLLHEHHLRQLTKDHSYVQYLVDKGRMTREEARKSPYRNMITRALGMEDLQVDLYEESVKAGDVVLLCSDGLSMYFSDAELQEILDVRESAQKKAKHLLDLALKRGGSDNISVILAMAPKGGSEND